MTSPISPNKPRVSRLGRGLSSLIGQPAPVSITPTAAPDSASPVTVAPPPPAAEALPAKSDEAGSGSSAEGLVFLAPAVIQPNPRQPRQHFDPQALQHLADSIKADGLMQPVIVRPRSDQEGQYELIAGERRWRAAQMAGLEKLPALVRPISDQQAAEWALIENLQREDLNPIERAHAFARLAREFDLSHEQIAARVGSDRSTIANLLRLLQLPGEVQQMVVDGHLSAGQARAILAVDDPAHQVTLAHAAVTGAWSVRETEQRVKKLLQGDSGAPLSTDTKPMTAGIPSQRTAQFRDLENQISQQLGTSVRIRAGKKKGTGTLWIEFYSVDQFDALLNRMGVRTEG